MTTATMLRLVDARPVAARPSNAPVGGGVFRHEVAARRGAWPADVVGFRDAVRRAAEDRRRPAAAAAVAAPSVVATPSVVPAPAITRSPEDMVEEYERWDGMA